MHSTDALTAHCMRLTSDAGLVAAIDVAEPESFDLAVLVGRLLHAVGMDLPAGTPLHHEMTGDGIDDDWEAHVPVVVGSLWDQYEQIGSSVHGECALTTVLNA